MTRRVALATLCCAAALVIIVPVTAKSPPESPATRNNDPGLNYMVHCQGCHKVDGSAQGNIVPALRGQVAKFLHTDDGRRFLVQVPGVAQSALNDRQTADVLNWILFRFDSANMPKSFAGYTEEEVHALRAEPISDTARARAALTAQIPGFKAPTGE